MTTPTEAASQRPAEPASPHETTELDALRSTQAANEVLFILLASSLDDQSLGRFAAMLRRWRGDGPSPERLTREYAETLDSVLGMIEEVRKGRRIPAS